MRLTVLIAVITSLIGLTGCNQSSQTSKTANTNTATSTEQAASTSASNMSADSHAAHMNHPSASTSHTQPAHINAYMAIMDTMHQDMSMGMQAKNADVAFAKGMIPHHQGAIEMAKVQLQYGKDAEMKALAQKIIDAQQGEINFMQQWLTKNEASQQIADNLEQITKAYQSGNVKNHDAMMQGMMEMNPDIAFAKGMIPHHQGAIDMADVEEKYGKNPEMLKLAKQIKQAQTPEIKQMQDWLTSKGN